MVRHRAGFPRVNPSARVRYSCNSLSSSPRSNTSSRETWDAAVARNRATRNRATRNRATRPSRGVEPARWLRMRGGP
eukprot:scaffold128028_cov24-Phaeocystis_antarctica.AAC.1